MSKQKPYSKQNYINIIKGETNWDKASLKAIKDDIREYVYTINNEKCFYCKSEIDDGTNNETIEHVVAKEQCPIFTFQPKNLTLACSDCNRIKNNDNVFNSNIINPQNLSFDNYPSNSSDYVIIHPYFDEYFQHINIDDIFYIGIDVKGKNTIKFYNLNRLQLAEKKIKEKRKNRQKISLAKNLLKNNNGDLKKIDDAFTSGKVIKFINKKVNSKNNWTTQCIESICKINYGTVVVFDKFKKLTKDYNNKEGIDSEFLKLENLEKGIEVVLNVLQMLKEIMSLIEDRRAIYTFLDVDFKVIESFFKEYEKQTYKNIQLEILFKFEKLISLIKEYECTYDGIKFQEDIKNDMNIIIHIKNEYILKSGTSQN